MEMGKWVHVLKWEHQSRQDQAVQVESIYTGLKLPAVRIIFSCHCLVAVQA